MQLAKTVIAGFVSVAFALSLLLGGTKVALGILLGSFVVWFFITGFEEMFFVYILVRPALDIFLGSGTDLGYSRVNLGALLSGLFIASSVTYLLRKRRPLRSSREVACFSLFLLFAFLGTVQNFDTVQWEGCFSFLRLLTVLFIMVISLRLVTTRQQMVKFFKCVLCSLIVPLIYAIVQLFTGINASSSEGYTRINGGFGSANSFSAHLGLFAIVTYVLLVKSPYINSKHRAQLKLFEVVLLLCLFYTFSRGGWLATVMSILLVQIFFMRDHFLFLSIACVLLLAVGLLGQIDIPLVGKVVDRFRDVQVWQSTAILGSTHNSLGWRIVYWKELLSQAASSPITGLGLGSIVNLGSAHLYAHNNYIQAFVETGFGSFFYFGTVLLFFQRAVKGVGAHDSMERAMSIAAIGLILFYFILSFSNHLIRNTIFQTYFFGLLTLMVSCQRLRVERYEQMRPQVQYG